MAEMARKTERDTAVDHQPPTLDLGHRILAERRRRSWSQRELGRRMGLRNDRISKLERGSLPSLQETVRLARTFAMSLDELVFGAPVPGRDAQPSSNIQERIEELERHLLFALRLLVLYVGPRHDPPDEPETPGDRPARRPEEKPR